MDLRLAIIEFQTLSSILLDDVEQVRNDYFATSSQTAARALIRAVFASIEGQTFALKRWALSRYKSTSVAADPAELALLEEVDFELNQKGKIIQRPARLATAANIRFAFEAMSRAHAFSYEFSAEDLGWKALQDALSVRHRLTHPKSSNDLHVEDDEVHVALAAREWFSQSITALLVGSVRTIATGNTSVLSELAEFEARWKVSSEKIRGLLMKQPSSRPTTRSTPTGRQRPAG